jgi:hypothetical protein
LDEISIRATSQHFIDDERAGRSYPRISIEPVSMVTIRRHIALS